MKKNKSTRYILFSLLTLLLTSSLIYAVKTHAVIQKDKKFSVEKLVINRGDTVSFPNEDPYYHNVYSMSPTKAFDLGYYKKGESRKVNFDKSGEVEVRCAIHPTMKMSIVVK